MSVSPASAEANSLFRRKPVGDRHGPQLNRTIGTFQLTMFGVGATVGTGIFFVLGQAVPEAGPAVILSFILAGIAAGLAAICYAEMASAVPVSGSTYSYAYATLGEIVAMGVAACLLLEYGVSTAAVAVGWSGYLNEALHNITGVSLPQAILYAPFAEDPTAPTGLINLPAVVLVFLCMVLLIRGASESAKVNAVMVVIKLSVLVMFSIIAFTAFDSNHFADFAPFGAAGVAAAAGTIFFSFIGLDAVSTAGDEVKDPQKTMPRALIGALFTVIAIYLLVAISAIGAQPWTDFKGQSEAGLSKILEIITGNNIWGTILALGAVISIFSVTLVTMYGQTRILFAMGRDGMLPKVFSKVSPQTQTPVNNTIIVAAVVSVLAAFVPLDYLIDLVSIGTLTAFIVVSLGVMILRYRQPDLPRGFKVPGFPVTPILSIVVCGYILISLKPITWLVFALWVGVFLTFYMMYGRKHSVLGRLLAGEKVDDEVDE
ncbi:putative amino acid transporter [Microlunatus phosphovorus NM-1]|uniref:Putative amino acid transporter n=1 Tax=Microlunatus phosphovorus (strain ATCC 700054 / DSM 10555 / JCM 9379 / NBRC 101784 / NCIMB 13414 / VKM Ac-1990 / NM-1) TaxID=1032480 RepID=F5XLE7_MICPN|nr:amino acid permease [Microlunatus phosphovorus]BAK36213.1 putative amino acid transporter [Microlunatus phosphovorus NM-1]